MMSSHRANERGYRNQDMVERSAGLSLKMGEMVGLFIANPGSGIVAKAMLDREGPQRFRGIQVRVNKLLRGLGEPTVTRRELSPRIALLVATGIVEEGDNRVYQFTEQGRKAAEDAYAI